MIWNWQRGHVKKLNHPSQGNSVYLLWFSLKLLDKWKKRFQIVILLFWLIWVVCRNHTFKHSATSTTCLCNMCFWRATSQQPVGFSFLINIIRKWCLKKSEIFPVVLDNSSIRSVRWETIVAELLAPWSMITIVIIINSEVHSARLGDLFKERYKIIHKIIS